MNAFADWQQASRRKWTALIVGLVGLAVALVAARADPVHFFRGYLAAYLFYFGLTMGSMVLVMIYHLTGGAWGFVIRRILEAATGTLPLVALLFVPIAFGVEDLYPWAARGAEAASPTVEHARPYLNVPFFLVRAAAFFGLLWLALLALGALAQRHDRTGDQRLVPTMRTAAGVCLVIYGVGLQFLAVDWVMSVQLPFHSTILGPLLASGHLVSALALAVMVLSWLSTRPPLEQFVSFDAVNDLGSLLFALLVVWSYMVWFQFMIIWIGNLPTDVIWYLSRSTGGWHTVAWFLLVFQFLIPLFLLLMREVKRNLRALRSISTMLVAMQIVYCFYLVLPSFGPLDDVGNWMGLPLVIGLGGVWLAFFLWRLERRPLMARYDYNQNEALRLKRKELEEYAHLAALTHN
jgi:hypothetical protein